jgi:hypothetical protein
MRQKVLPVISQCNTGNAIRILNHGCYYLHTLQFSLKLIEAIKNSIFVLISTLKLNHVSSMHHHLVDYWINPITAIG